MDYEPLLQFDGEPRGLVAYAEQNEGTVFPVSWPPGYAFRLMSLEHSGQFKDRYDEVCLQGLCITRSLLAR